MTEAQKQVLMMRLSKMSMEPEKVAPYFEELDIHPGNFGIEQSARGYEIWVEDSLPFSNLAWGIQAYVPADKIKIGDYPVEASHLIPIFTVLKEVKEKTTKNPDHRDSRVTYISGKK